MNKLINKCLDPSKVILETLYAKEGLRLIPKALFGTGLVRRGLKWISNHMAPTREQTMFEVQNNQRKEVLKKKEKTNKSRTVADLQRDLIKFGYLSKGEDDGAIGPKTRKAIAKAKQDGYTVDMNTFTIKSTKQKLSKRSLFDKLFKTPILSFKKSPENISLEEYIASKQQEVRKKAAVINMETATPYFPLGNYLPRHSFDFYGTGSDGRAKARGLTLEQVRQEFINYRNEAQKYLDTHPNISNEAKNKVIRSINYYNKVIKDPMTVARSGSGIGFGCIYSATGAYDLENLPTATRNKIVYANNRQLAQNIMRKGSDSPYIIIPFDENNLLVGDIILLGTSDSKIGPHHAAMVTGFKEVGPWYNRRVVPTLTETLSGRAGMSDRNIDSEKSYYNIIKRSKEDGDPTTPGIQPEGLQVVRFVGDSNLVNLWKREYAAQYNR